MHVNEVTKSYEEHRKKHSLSGRLKSIWKAIKLPSQNSTNKIRVNTPAHYGY